MKSSVNSLVRKAGRIRSGELGVGREGKFLAFFVGIYYGAAAIKNNGAIRWVQSDQMADGKKSADFGQPVLRSPALQ
ncbi:hypothetical protein [Lysobacter sp. CA199]|uniref:hypothetical protein n=1 Tax=Lysobacter sp. CA199 TaxID=3455608 RepID=UPI003F8D2B8B